MDEAIGHGARRVRLAVPEERVHAARLVGAVEVYLVERPAVVRRRHLEGDRVALLVVPDGVDDLERLAAGREVRIDGDELEVGRRRLDGGVVVVVVGGRGGEGRLVADHAHERERAPLPEELALEARHEGLVALRKHRATAVDNVVPQRAQRGDPPAVGDERAQERQAQRAGHELEVQPQRGQLLRRNQQVLLRIDPERNELRHEATPSAASMHFVTERPKTCTAAHAPVATTAATRPPPRQPPPPSRYPPRNTMRDERPKPPRSVRRTLRAVLGPALLIAAPDGCRETQTPPPAAPVVTPTQSTPAPPPPPPQPPPPQPAPDAQSRARASRRGSTSAPRRSPARCPRARSPRAPRDLRVAAPAHDLRRALRRGMAHPRARAAHGVGARAGALGRVHRRGARRDARGRASRPCGERARTPSGAPWRSSRRGPSTSWARARRLRSSRW